MCFHVLRAFFSGFLCISNVHVLRCYYNYTNKPKADCFCQLSGNKAPEPVESIWVGVVRFMWSFSYRSKRQNSTTTFENHEQSWKRERFAGKLLSISSMMSCRDPCWGEPAVCFRGCFCPANDSGWQNITGYLIRASPELRMATSELDWIFATIKSQHFSSPKLSGWLVAEWSPINDLQEENQPLPFGKSDMSPRKIPKSFLVNTIKNGGVSMATC